MLMTVGLILCFLGTMYEMVSDALRYATLLGIVFLILGGSIWGYIVEEARKKKYEEEHIIRRL